MIRSILMHAAVLGDSCVAIRRFHVLPSHQVLGFVSSNRPTHFTVGSRIRRRNNTIIKGVDWRLLMSSIDQSDIKVEDLSGEIFYRDSADCLMYDDNIDTNEEGADESTNTDDTPSRAYLLHKALFRSAQSALKTMKKKTVSLERELEKAQSLEETMSRANLIISNLYRLTPGTTSMEVEDWENDGKIVELVLNTKEYSSAQEESDALFALARKMKRGSKVVEELLRNSLEAETILNDGLSSLAGSINLPEDTSFDNICENFELDEGELVLIQEKLERTSEKTGFKSPNWENLFNKNVTPKTNRLKAQNDKVQRETRYKPNPRELISPSGHKVLVGRNRRDNEAICFQLSRPTDVWMHSRGCPGAHVLLCVRRGSPEVTDDDLQFAADLAAFYSDARTERKAEVTTAEPKHIAKPRGAPPGAVTLRQEGKTLMGRPENVSNDLKEAREMSGGAWDEMGYKRDGTRAKNKKRTAAVEKATREKKRQEANAKNKRKARKEDRDWY